MKKILKNNAIAIAGFLIIGVYNLTADLFVKGADATFNEKVDARFKHNMENPIILNQVLNSGPVSDFALNASDKVYHNLEEKARIEDSLSIDLIEFIGRELSIRNEDVKPFIIKLGKAYLDGELVTQEELDKRTRRALNANF